MAAALETKLAPPSAAVMQWPAGTSSEMEFDDAKMMVRCLASTATLDREKDFVTPDAFNLDNYARNPVVLYQHDQKTPIGKCEDPDGRFTMTRTENALVADVYFAKSSPFAASVYALYREKVLRGWSIGYLPTQTSRVSVNGKAARRLMDVDIIELSAVSVPANPEALTIAVKSGMFRGERLPGVLVKSLAAKLPPVTRLAVAFPAAIYTSPKTQKGPLVMPDIAETPVVETVATEAEAPVEIETKAADVTGPEGFRGKKAAYHTLASAVPQLASAVAGHLGDSDDTDAPKQFAAHMKAMQKMCMKALADAAKEYPEHADHWKSLEAGYKSAFGEDDESDGDEEMEGKSFKNQDEIVRRVIEAETAKLAARVTAAEAVAAEAKTVADGAGQKSAKVEAALFVLNDTLKLLTR